MPGVRGDARPSSLTIPSYIGCSTEATVIQGDGGYVSAAT